MWLVGGFVTQWPGTEIDNIAHWALLTVVSNDNGSGRQFRTHFPFNLLSFLVSFHSSFPL